MIHVCTLLWDANNASQSFSRCYDAEWVNKLYRGIERNLTQPFKFVLFTERWRDVDLNIAQRRMLSDKPSYANCIEPYSINKPMILMGLDTVITGNIDHLADYCLTGDVIALPRDPYHPSRACNGVALVPAGNEHVFTAWNGENDMDWMRKQEHVFIDDLWPGQVQSYKGAVRDRGLGDTRICYFHGAEKPHEIEDAWVKEHWV